MRAFSCHPSSGERIDPVRGRSLLLLLSTAALLPLASPLAAQWPAEVRGRAVDAVTGSAVDGAEVRILGDDRAAVTDSRGRFEFRGLEPGPVTLVVEALGYAAGTERLQLENGRVVRPVVVLSPAALPVEGLEVRGRSPAPDLASLERTDIEEAGGRTVGEVLSRVGAVSVRSRGPGGAETASIRGSGGDGVLVLVDGIPVNDPITGAADLSALPAASVERITVLPGARTARFGPRAEGGVILVETRGAAGRPAREASTASAWLGSLGRRGGESRLRAGGGAVRGEVGAHYDAFEGAFPFEGGVGSEEDGAVRRNADLSRVGLDGGVAWEYGDGSVRMDGEIGKLDRGLPGKSYAPSPSAREVHLRRRLAATWRTEGSAARASVAGYLARNLLEIADSAPPLGLPFDEDTRLEGEGVRAALSLSPGRGRTVRELGLGLDLDRQSVRSTALAPGIVTRTDLGLWLRAEAEPWEHEGVPRLSGAFRAHRDGLAGGWRGSHELALRSRVGGLTLHVAHRSGFSPPTLADQFFREGVAVRPNPDLRPERVPGELEAGAAYRGRVGPAVLGVDATSFSGDVEGMIVWAPDFQFVWSPRNVDVRRDGVELRGEVALPGLGLRLRGGMARSRVVYDRERQDVQLEYRPRHTADVTGEWEGSGFRGAITARFVGARNTSPTRVNGLPGFWTFDLDLRRRWSWAGWVLDTAARIDRLLDRTQPFIHGFPEPGRTVEMELTLRTPR